MDSLELLILLFHPAGPPCQGPALSFVRIRCPPQGPPTGCAPAHEQKRPAPARWGTGRTHSKRFTAPGHTAALAAPSAEGQPLAASGLVRSALRPKAVQPHRDAEYRKQQPAGDGHQRIHGDSSFALCLLLYRIRWKMSRYFKDFQKCSAALPHGRTVLPALAVRPHRGGFCAPVPAGCPFVDKPSAAFYNNRNSKRKPV